MLLLFFVGSPEVGDPKNGIPYGSPRAHIYARVSDFLVAPDCTTVHFRLIFVSYCSFSSQICLIAVHFSSCVPSVASQQSWSGTAVQFGSCVPSVASQQSWSGTAVQFGCTAVQFGCTEKRRQTLGRICNPTATSIRTCSPIIALQMLILTATGFLDKPSVTLRDAERQIQSSPMT